MLTRKHHLQEVKRKSRSVCPVVAGEAVGDRADDQQVGHAPRDHLADPPVPPVRSVEMKVSVAAGDAGEPDDYGHNREEDLRKTCLISAPERIMSATEEGCKTWTDLSQHALLPGGVRAVKTQSQCAAVLVHGHAHVFQEEERVVRLPGGQQVNCSAATSNSGSHQSLSILTQHMTVNICNQHLSINQQLQTQNSWRTCGASKSLTSGGGDQTQR